MNQATMNIDEWISQLQSGHQNHSKDMYKALTFADVLCQRDLAIHDRGTIQAKSIQTYLTTIDLIQHVQNDMVASGENVRMSHQSL